MTKTKSPNPRPALTTPKTAGEQLGADCRDIVSGGGSRVLRRSLSLSHTCSLSYTHTFSLSFAHTHSLYLSLKYTCTLARTLKHTHAYTLSLSISLPLT